MQRTWRDVVGIDLLAGVLYIGLGSYAAIEALSYRMGTPARMGPGYFPFWTGLLLAAIGLAVALIGLRNGVRSGVSPEQALPKLEIRALTFVLGPVVCFAVLLEHGGFVLAVGALALLSSFASREGTWRSAVLNALFIVVMSVVIFKLGLGLPFDLWPSALSP